MRAAEVLNRYANGERNFQGVNLKGQNFHNKDLRGVDFSHADLRGANFSEAKLQGSDLSYANLRGANFSEAKLQGANLSHVQCGLQKHWLFIFWIAVLLTSAYLGFTADSFLKQKDIYFWLLLTLFIALLAWLLHKLLKRYDWKNSIVPILLFPVYFGTLVAFGLGHLVAPLLGTFLVSTLLCTFCIELGQRRYTYVAIFTLCMALLFWFLLHQFEVIKTSESWMTFAFTQLFIGMLVNGKFWRQKDLSNTLRDFSFTFSIYGGIGSKFNASDLIDADFSHANLMHTDMRKANILGTRWFGARCLEYAALDAPPLKDLQVRQLLISGDGQNQNFDGKDLSCVYLSAANLAGASFRGSNLSQSRLLGSNLSASNLSQAKLSHSNLSKADLTGAQLVQTQLADANLTEATLTGACIEDWNITTRTILDRVSCRFVFMRQIQSDTHENPHRKPDDWEQEFEDGDFSDFIKPLSDTLDLYHNRNVDPRAVAIAFQKLSNDNPDANLFIAAMESRGEDKLLLRAKTDENADQSDLHRQYFQNYDEVSRLSPSEQKKLYFEMNSRIKKLENKIDRVFSQTTVYIANLEGDFVQGEVGNFNWDDRSIRVGGDMSGNVVGDQNTADIQIQQAELPEAQAVNIHQELVILKQLLTQLQSEDQRKIENALSDAEDELKKPQPDKDEVGQALGRALDYAQKAEGFASSIDKLRPHVANAAGWLGKNWYKLLAIVGLAA